MNGPSLSAQAIEQQQALYGVSLGDAVRSIAASLKLSQAGVARVLGLSAPMLSQLVNGQRLKIGNPIAVQRLHALLGLVEEVRDGLPFAQVGRRLEEISTDSTGTLTQPQTRTVGADVPSSISSLLRAVASGRELSAAADLLEQAHPDIAEVIRVYGTGRPDAAARHYASLAHLL